MKKAAVFLKNWRMCIPFLFLYLEIVFHLYMRLDMAYVPVFLLLAGAAGMFCAGILFFLPELPAKIVGAVITAAVSLLFVIECISRDILQQYFQIFSAVETAAGNKLTDYASTVVQSVRENAGGVFLLFVLPLLVYTVWVKMAGTKKGGQSRKDEEDGTESRAGQAAAAGKGRKKEAFINGLANGLLSLAAAVLVHGAALAVIFFVPWQGDFTPEMLYCTDTNTDDQVEQLGVIAMLRLDVRNQIFGVPESSPAQIDEEASAAVTGEEQENEAEEEKEIVYPYNEMDIDFDALKASASGSGSAWLNEYFASLIPTRQNEYTGMFEGYNVIFITAEGFSGYMIDPELTPTLYKLSHEGFVFNNFYSTLHFTSTSGGEFQNLTGLYPKAGFPVSMSETGKQGIYLPFTLANQLNRLGYTSIGYHFNQNMYGRELSHPNLGYEWRQFTECASPLTAETNEYGNAYWPQSDDYMISQTFDEYKNLQPFNIYYLTISGHLPYSFDGSQMSQRNRELVEALPYSEKTKAYIAANLELEKGLTRLVDDLEEAGIADKTLIVMAPDHIPYSDLDVLEELAGRSFNAESLENLDEKTVDVDVYRNTWILWSASMDEPVTVDKPCSQVDILPTVSNLLGLQYDSRMMAGTDVLSSADPIVVFFSNSWLTEKGMYNRYTGTFEPAEGVVMSEEEKNAYVENIKYIVSSRLSLGQLIIENDYYRQAPE